MITFTAFGWQAPTYAHLPPVQGPGGTKKLSKRDGAQSVGEYIEEGYLPEALMSFLASLGWNDGTTQEVYTPSELIEKFTLQRVQKSPAMFDKERLTWVNGLLIRQMPLNQLLDRCAGFWPLEAAACEADYKQAVLGLVQERLKFFAELSELTEFFFKDPKLDLTLFADGSADLIQAASVVLESSDFSQLDLETKLRTLSEELQIKPGQLFSALRIAVTGRKAAPGIFVTLHTLGQTVTLNRLVIATKLLNR
jgi:glutamyl/glutaminyl-tRNA synthetase